MNIKKDRLKVFVGVTNDDEFYFLEMDNTRNYFSMSGFSVSPVTLERAKEMSYDSLRDLVEQDIEGITWKSHVDIDAICESIQQNDGELAMIDTSLLDIAVDVDGKEYLFLSESCGQHEVSKNEIKKFFINENAFISFMDLWKKYHLKTDIDYNNSTAGDIISWFKETAENQENNLSELLQEAIKSL